MNNVFILIKSVFNKTHNKHYYKCILEKDSRQLAQKLLFLIVMIMIQ